MGIRYYDRNSQTWENFYDDEITEDNVGRVFINDRWKLAWDKDRDKELYARIYRIASDNYILVFEKGEAKRFNGLTLLFEAQGSGTNGFLSKTGRETDATQQAPWYKATTSTWNYTNDKNKIKKVIFSNDYISEAVPHSLRNYFIGMGNLEEIINISNLDVRNIITANGAFADCPKVQELDLSGWVFSGNCEVNVLFRGMTKLKTIYATDSLNFSNCTVYTNMFINCTSLVGGNGTAYNASNVGKSYAVVDRPGTPGYFTEKVEE